MYQLLSAIVIFAVSSLTMASLASEDQQAMSFRVLSQTDGLSQNTVNHILQDSQSFLWFATEGGLNRYDGIEFHSYLSQPGVAGALPDEFIWSMAEDAQGDLWLATRGAGLLRWSRKDDTFSAPMAQLIAQWPGSDQARSVMIDHQGRVWLGTVAGGLLQLDTQGQPLYRIGMDDPKPGTVYTMYQLNSKQILLGAEHGLWSLNPDNRTLNAYPARWPQGHDVAVSSILHDRNGEIWLGSFEHGLLRIGLDGQNRHYPLAADELQNANIRALMQDDAGRIWIATQSGLLRYLPASDSFAHYRHSPDDRFSLSDDRLMSMMQDSNGLLWIGTRGSGVNRWSPASWALGSRAPKQLNGVAVLAFAEARDGDIWIGGFGAPLQRFDAGGQLSAEFTPANGFPDRGRSPVTSLLRANNGDLWIGSFDAGLQRFSPEKSELDWLRHNPEDNKSLGSDGIMCLMQSRDESIWVGSFGGGLARINPKPLTVQRIAPDLLGKHRITALSEDASGQIWIGTEAQGLYRYPANAQAEPAVIGQFKTVYSLHSSRDGTLWIGTAEAGLHKIDAEQLQQAQPRISPAPFQQTLPSQSIYGIKQDNNGQLWISTNRGLARINAQSAQVRKFHRAQGLHAEELNYGAAYQASDGRLFFGGLGGYNQIDAAQLQDTRDHAKLQLTALEKFNQPVKQARPYGQLKKLTLDHDDSVVSFGYALLDYADPAKNLYSVKLDGFDRNWSPLSRHSRSTYTNLDPGDYVFRMRAVSSAGVPIEARQALEIHVKTAPWDTPFARSTYLLSALLVLLLLYRWRIKVAQREAHIEQLAYYDQVTGLPNRELYVSRTDARLSKPASDRVLCVLVIRIGPLKHLLDSLGYHPSNDLLRSLASRLNQALFGHGESSARRALARLGEESFVVTLMLQHPDSEALRWARRLQSLIAEPLEFGDNKIQVPAQIGIACAPRDGESAEMLIQHAETAARDTLSSGANSISFYEPNMTARAKERLSLESELRHAIHNNQLQLYLQGKFSVDGELVGAEALCRWPHPQRGQISPGVFVPLAEESELIMDLDDWVMNQACATLDNWHRQGIDKLSIAVNISAETFVSGRIFTALERNRSRYQLPASQLEIEVTESVLASDMQLITRSLSRIKQMGHLLSLDDFGTGYSSLTYLQQFPIDKLKIDQAFVRDLENQREQLSLCRAIIALASGLNLKTIAEGVENAKQQEILTALGCDTLQGFHLHRPQAVQDFQEQFLSRVPRNNS